MNVYNLFLRSVFVRTKLAKHRGFYVLVTKNSPHPYNCEPNITVCHLTLMLKLVLDVLRYSLGKKEEAKVA